MVDKVHAFSLKCSVKNYKWGKVGYDSEVAKLAAVAVPDIEIDNEENYAELWMGTHPSGPSFITEFSQGLDEWISKNPECLGEKLRGKFGSKLPFLFKVLSVNKALSIQIHPNKEEAERLHKEDPEHYPDPNHKPEIAIALTRFEALCGFRPIDDIIRYFEIVPELFKLVGHDNVEFMKSNKGSEALKRCFSALMMQSEDDVKNNLENLISRIQILANKNEDISNVNGELLLRTYSQFPGDVGCFAIFFLNYITLEPGQSIFLYAKVPHAYLFGDCVECMACSDNVVRSGLTPKFKDVSRLIEMLDFTSKNTEDQFFKGLVDPDDSSITIFNPPVSDFTVRMIKFQEPGRKTMKGIDSASLLLVVEGSADATCKDKTFNLQRGSVMFLAKDLSFHIDQSSSSLVMFQAYCLL